MKNLLKFVPICLVLACSSLFANTQENQDLEITTPVRNSFVYVNGGVSIGGLMILDNFASPLLGFGYRKQVSHHGLDLSISIAASSTNWAIVRTSFLYNCFFKPNLHSQFYAGIGFAINYYILEKKQGFGPFFTPELVLGWQKNNTFLQIQAHFDVIFAGTLSYGIGF